MNKIKYLLLAAAFASTAVFTSCSNDEEEDIEIVLAMAGEYEGSETCDGAEAGPYKVSIYNTASEENMVWVENIWDYAPKVKAIKDSDNQFTLVPQQVIHRGTTAATNDTFNIVSGSGTINDRDLTFNFVLNYGGDAVNCQFVGKRR